MIVLHFLSDIDECEVADMMGMPLCIPNGMCRNELDGAFYSCDCDPGFTEDGDPSVAPLTCVGMQIIHIHTCMYMV